MRESWSLLLNKTLQMVLSVAREALDASEDDDGPQPHRAATNFIYIIIE